MIYRTEHGFDFDFGRLFGAVERGPYSWRFVRNEATGYHKICVPGFKLVWWFHA